MSTAAPPEVQSVGEGDEGEGLASAASAYIERLKAGDVGSLPVVFGLIIATIYFTARVPVFFSANNFVNLITARSPASAPSALRGSSSRRRTTPSRPIWRSCSR